MVMRDFFVFEGIDGAGTTTQLEAVSRRLSLAGKDVHSCAEPTSGPVGTLVRHALSGSLSLSQATLALLFAADREEHVNGAGGILERLGRKEIVLCDRYLFSSLAYQSISADPALPFSLNGRFPLPETLFFFDIDPAVAMERIKARKTRDIFESSDFMASVAERYRTIIEMYRGTGMRITRIDASLPKDEITQAIISGIEAVSA
jgi:dTMP kinase